MSATAIVRTRRKVCASSIFDHDALEHVPHLLAAVEGVLKEYVQIFQLYDLEWWELTAEELCDSVTCGRVADILEPVYLGTMLLAPLTRFEFSDCLLELYHRLYEQAC